MNLSQVIQLYFNIINLIARSQLFQIVKLLIKSFKSEFTFDYSLIKIPVFAIFRFSPVGLTTSGNQTITIIDC